ncbi:HmuY family protein [Dyadobacter sp. CY261]|uniref:HmuY family protein n=1 Tax=Dyadobacter sp. CY261 TaxID=2907203 RepID=UPI001F3FE037|nr:HmuY family protein [Dyadobacter sp. CY261]MCF0074543.1 HmuY family protein [Dyadobacter sp. CY261]
MLLKSIILSAIALSAMPERAAKQNFVMQKAAAKPEIKVIKDLNANTKSYIYFSLATGKEVPATDAKTKNWDIAFSKTTIATNSGTSGPGEGGAIVLEKPFDQVTEAPKDGFKTDGDAGFAIPGGSGNSWYKYDMSVHAILPIPGRTLLVKTANGKVAKVEIISYYKGAPEDVPTEESSYYTFRYAIAGEDRKF